MAEIDQRDFRDALGHFATGVTIVTTVTGDGAPVGLTVNSFNSVSLDPPLVLWSLARSSRNLRVFTAAEHFAVNVLAADQADLAQRFAGRDEDKFAGVHWVPGAGGMPLIAGCAARFQCRVSFRYEGGDHLIFVGEVVALDQSGKPALVFHRGRYTTAEEPETPGAGQRSRGGGFLDDYLLYLLTRASRQLNKRFLEEVGTAGLERRHWRVLAVLSDGDGRRIPRLAEMTLMREEVLRDELQEMEQEGLIERRAEPDGTHVYVTEAGYRRVVNLLAAARAHEDDLLDRLDVEDAGALKRALLRLIEHTR